MPLIPNRVKRRRVHRGRMKGNANKGNVIAYGDYGLMACESTWITSNQIEAARIAMTRYIKRGGKVWIDIFPHKPITRKPAETRMGSGKGSVDYWVAVVKPNRIMFEMSGVSEEIAREAMRLASHKLPCKCKFVAKGNEPGAVVVEEKSDKDAKQEAKVDAKTTAKKDVKAPKDAKVAKGGK